MNHLPVFLIGLAGGVFLDEFDFGNELPGTPQKAVDWAEPPFPPIKIMVTNFGTDRFLETLSMPLTENGYVQKMASNFGKIFE